MFDLVFATPDISSLTRPSSRNIEISDVIYNTDLFVTVQLSNSHTVLQEDVERKERVTQICLFLSNQELQAFQHIFPTGPTSQTIP